MYLYELLKEVSKIITPVDDSFFNYALHTFDNNGGFLRTRYCWFDNCLEDQKISKKDYRVILLTAREPFTKDDFKSLRPFEETKVKMQLDYCNKDATFDYESIFFDLQNDYTYIYLIDLINKTIQMKHFEIDLTQKNCIREIESD